jgi:hypothetical protein
MKPHIRVGLHSITWQPTVTWQRKPHTSDANDDVIDEATRRANRSGIRRRDDSNNNTEVRWFNGGGGHDYLVQGMSSTIPFLLTLPCKLTTEYMCIR